MSFVPSFMTRFRPLLSKCTLVKRFIAVTMGQESAEVLIATFAFGAGPNPGFIYPGGPHPVGLYLAV